MNALFVGKNKEDAVCRRIIDREAMNELPDNYMYREIELIEEQEGLKARWYICSEKQKVGEDILH